MKKILLTNHYSEEVLDIVYSQLPEGFKLCFLSEQKQWALNKEIDGIDYLLAGGRLKIDEQVLRNANKLKMIQRSGVGLDSIDLDALRAHGIPLYVNRGVNAESVAEHTLLLMLACLRHLPELDRNTKNGIWKKQEQGIRTHELRGKTIGIVGMGNIAKRVVSFLKPFDVKILYYDLFQTEKKFEEDHNMRFVNIEELLSQSDIVTLHCALTEDTRKLINNKSISNMKTGSILVNTARGGLVDTRSLEDALESGKIGYAALDVHEEEPIPNEYLFKNVENIILTPHVGGVTYDSFRTMMHDAFRNIKKFEDGELEKISQYRYL